MNLQRVSNNHFSNEFGYLLRGHFKNLGEGLNAERLILAGSSKEEGLESRLFEVNCKHIFELFTLNLGHTLDERDRGDVVNSGLPVRFIEGTGS
jgi:hypothetical protein